MSNQGKKINNSIISRAFIIYVLSGLFTIAIIYSLIKIQFVEGEDLRKKAQDLAVKYIDIKARRGNILSDDGSLLSTSVPKFDLYVDLSEKTIKKEVFNDSINKLSLKLSNFFKSKTAEQYKKELTSERNKNNRYYCLCRNLDYFEMKQVASFPIFNMGRYKGGLIIEQKDRREMPFGSLAKRTIGFSRKNFMVGLEGAYDSLLRGVDGKRLMRRVSGKHWVPVENKDEILQQDGKDVVSTIDIHLQDVAQTALAEHLSKHEAHHGCAVLMEVQTGEIKAITNLQRMPNGNYVESYNYAIGELYEPGSSFKLISMLVAIEDGLVNLNENVNTGNGKLKFGKSVMIDSHRGGFGTISARQAFELSSNIGISYLIVKHYGNNPTKFIDGLKKLGINKPLGISIKGEGTPYIKSNKDKTWSVTSLPWMSIGYELLMTPLQILNVYNAVANNGTMMKPMFVKELKFAGQTIKKFEPIVLNKAICSQKTILQAQNLLEGVVLRGTATNLKNAILPIAGKTATAQIATTSGYKGKAGAEYYASFVGYFPADKPRYSCIVVVNRPQSGQYYGGTVAAPVFLEIAEKIFATRPELRQQDSTLVLQKSNYGNIYATYSKSNDICKNLNIKTTNKPIANNDDYTYLTNNADTISYRIIKNTQGKLINLKGMSAQDAIYYLEQNGAIVSISGKGWVKNQYPEEGTKIRKNMRIKLILGNR